MDERALNKTPLVVMLIAVSLIFVMVVVYVRVIHWDYLPQSELEKIFDGHMQSSSNTKPFNYKISSFDEALDSTLEGVVWCVIIEPPLESYVGRSSVIYLNHFVMALQGPDWNVFGLVETKQAAWIDAGCQDW